MLTPTPEQLTRATAPEAERDTAPAPEKPSRRAQPTENLVYLSGRVPKALRAELQHQAIREGRPIAQLLQDAVRAYLDVHNST